MADNVAITAGSGTNIATEDISSVHYQKTIVGATKRISQTPTISTSAYAIKDAVGGKLTFTDAARFSGGGGVITGVTIVDKDQERAPLELVLFNQDFTASTDNAVFDPTDADLANVVTVIPISQYSDLNDNAVGYADNLNISFNCNTTLLYGQLLIRSAATYTATSDIIVILHIWQE